MVASKAIGSAGWSDWHAAESEAPVNLSQIWQEAGEPRGKDPQSWFEQSRPQLQILLNLVGREDCRPHLSTRGDGRTILAVEGDHTQPHYGVDVLRVINLAAVAYGMFVAEGKTT